MNSKSQNKTESTIVSDLSSSLRERIREAGGTSAIDVQAVFNDMMKNTLQTLLDVEMEEHLGYPAHDPAGNNTGNSRNGRSKKKVRSSQGELFIETPRDRNGTFEPATVRKRQTNLGKFEDNVISLYARGLTTREIEEHLKEMYDVEVSPSFISRATDAVTAESKEWQSRPLEPLYAVIYMDGIRFSVRDNGRIKKKCVYVCLGIDTEGRQDVLGLWIADTESASFWVSVMNELKSRGTEDILIACVDGLTGFPEAIEAVYPDTHVQLCVVHQIRTSTKHISYKDRKAFCRDLRDVYTAPTEEAALAALLSVEQKWGEKYPASVQCWHRDWDKLVTFLQYPPELRKFIYTTNSIESLNAVLRKNTRNRKVFPNDESLLKLLYLNIRKQTVKWRKRQGWAKIFNQLMLIFPERLQP